jgi:hypothetical protein
MVELNRQKKEKNSKKEDKMKKYYVRVYIKSIETYEVEAENEEEAMENYGDGEYVDNSLDILDQNAISAEEKID